MTTDEILTTLRRRLEGRLEMARGNARAFKDQRYYAEALVIEAKATAYRLAIDDLDGLVEAAQRAANACEIGCGCGVCLDDGAARTFTAEGI